MLRQAIELSPAMAADTPHNYRAIQVAAWFDRLTVNEILAERVSPMASIDAAPLPEYMQGREAPQGLIECDLFVTVTFMPRLS